LSWIEIIIACSAALGAPVSPSPLSPHAASRDERLLAAHNVERVRVGAKPLTWSPILAENAQKWANHLAGTATFEHAVISKAEGDQGENLWMGTRQSYEVEEMVQAWIDERKLYKPGKFPANSTSGNWTDVGHYTQLIWHDTRKVGCAIAANQNDEFLVCRYDPPGNWQGQNPLER
jgi:uncharacterized protein YkwD